VIDLKCEGLQELAFMIVLTVLVMGVVDQLMRNDCFSYFPHIANSGIAMVDLASLTGPGKVLPI
jgi:hypothetical protein